MGYVFLKGGVGQRDWFGKKNVDLQAKQRKKQHTKWPLSDGSSIPTTATSIFKFDSYLIHILIQDSIMT